MDSSLLTLGKNSNNRMVFNLKTQKTEVLEKQLFLAVTDSAEVL